MVNSGILEALIFLGISILFYIFQPKERNGIYGYRTPLSQKNDRNWKFANQTAAKWLLGLSLITLFVTGVTAYFTNYNAQAVFLILLLSSFVFILFYVEYSLRKDQSKL